MRVGFLQINAQEYISNTSVYNITKKSGSRIEHSLTLNTKLIQLGQQITSLPLRYASIVIANVGDEDQEFHADDNSGERAILYLTNVENDTHGPIEFKHGGKILGSVGTYVHYNANEVHRGCKSDIQRYALALAFDSNPSKLIQTVGIAPPPSPTPSTQNNFWFWFLLIVAIILSIMYMYKPLK